MVYIFAGVPSSSDGKAHENSWLFIAFFSPSPSLFGETYHDVIWALMPQA